MGFDDTLENDHLNMLSINEFGTQCFNNRNSQTISVIKTNAFIQMNNEGLPITSETPMFNTSELYLDENGNKSDVDILQDDLLTIESKDYYVFDVRKDGIGGLDIYLKDSHV
jgi:hypothetical protein